MNQSNPPKRVTIAGKELAIVGFLVEAGETTHAILFGHERQQTPNSVDLLKSDLMWKTYRDVTLHLDGRTEEFFVARANPVGGLFYVSEGDPLAPGNELLLLVHDSRLSVITVAELATLTEK